MLMADPGVGYLELVLRLEVLAPGLVESCHGPAELAEVVRGQAPVQAAELAEHATQLSEELGQTERCHGVAPTLVADQQFAEAHELLNAALRLCRSFLDDDPARFKRLLREQLTPGDLVADTAAR
jgi:hypothetical protein